MSRFTWNQGLISYIRKEDKDIPNLVLSNALCIVIPDAFPKARYHYLVLPRGEEYESIKSLEKSDAKEGGILEYMEYAGNETRRKILEMMKKKNQVGDILMGFHSIPSMKQLHMHVISNDYISECLKTKKHYNSFTTEFFIPLEKVRSQLMKFGHVLVDKEESEKRLLQDMKCHRCGIPISNIPKLKQHLIEEVDKYEGKTGRK